MSTKELKYELIQRLIQVDSDQFLRQILKLVMEEEKEAELRRFQLEHVLRSQEDIAAGRLVNHETVTDWMEMKISA